jgi:RNA recognition motif-containing protein|uniref:RRM domain-containing protein n=1 Tax=Eutreptiella gymnastica TaxID=73025 RepID=A0A6T2BNL8_9EUGL
MDGLKESLAKLEQLRLGGFIARAEFDRRKKQILDEYIGISATGGAPRASNDYPATDSTVCRLRGLPFTATEQDVINFFYGFKMDTAEPVRFQMTADGGHSGLCFVKFATVEEAARAQTKNRQYLGQRYIEIYPSSVEEMDQQTAPVGVASWVRMRGLPWEATKHDVKAFFNGFNVSESDIFMVTRKGGRASGEAFVRFDDEREAQRARYLKDKESMGMRYIELFLVTRKEYDEAVARHQKGPVGRGKGYGGDGGKGGYGGGYNAGYGGGGYGGMGKGYRRMDTGADAGDNVVRLRGLPWRATEWDISQFLGRGLNIAQITIIYQGGRSSGQAFVEFYSKYGVQGALQRDRQLMDSRYIEVFPSSKAEMYAYTAGDGMGGGGYGYGYGMGGYGGYPGY